MSYLQLYYCKLHHFKALAFLILVLWLGLLFSTIGIAASDFFCINLSTIATILGMSESMAGVTFLAFGNGSPDVFSTFAAMKTHSGSLAVGELIGAAGFITAVVAGSMALVRPFKVAKTSFVRDVGFFIVAASFSMVFLSDGHLYLWECATMVGFYVFYVITVVVWHWYLGLRRRRKAREILARGHFNVTDTDEVEGDNDNDEAVGNRGRGASRSGMIEDFAALERGGSPFIRVVDEDEDEDEETRDRWMAEINSSMRINRPPLGERHNTPNNPIRPSLVGALEFRAVLSSLHKSRNIQTIPINLRRYSDDPSFTLAQQARGLGSRSNPELDQLLTDSHEVVSNHSRGLGAEGDRSSPATRIRAVSANDATGLYLDPSTLHKSIPQIDLLGPTPPASAKLQIPSSSSAPDSSRLSEPHSPSLLLSPPSVEPGVRRQNSFPTRSAPSDRLEPPPQGGYLGFNDYEHDTASRDRVSRHGLERRPSRGSFSTLPGSGGSSPAVPFPAYHDDPDYTPTISRAPSFRLPPSLGSDSVYHQHYYEQDPPKPIRWWPYKILPLPAVLMSTLFPTIYSWHSKNAWEKLLGLVAAPSVFLLAITLPVVEAEHDDSDEVPDTVVPDPGLLNSRDTHMDSESSAATIIPSDSFTSEPIDLNFEESDQLKGSKTRPESLSLGIPNPTVSGEQGIPDRVATMGENGHQLNDRTGSYSKTNQKNGNHIRQGMSHSSNPPPSSPKEWNRWLVSTQIFTSPFFIVLIIWANTDPTLSSRNLFIPYLYTLIGSLVVFALVLLTTSDAKPPRYRFLLCFLGFVVSIAWISTIANEVVGVLKAFGVILGISDAILGLTIFAVGNSLGDLVADITVAKLGYPVMALSACFGGPMLNILLGIGLSGLYMTITDGNGRHHRHPQRPIQYRPYQVEISHTLVISGVTLLVTLVGLLIVVPLNKWQMDRRIGWGLVILWCTSTVGNLAVEISGLGGASTSM